MSKLVSPPVRVIDSDYFHELYSLKYEVGKLLEALPEITPENYPTIGRNKRDALFKAAVYVRSSLRNIEHREGRSE